MYVGSAKQAWDMLDTLYNVTNGVQKLKLERELFYTQQEDASVTEYYAKMKALWEEREAMRVLPAITELSPEVNAFTAALNKEREELRLFQFLNGIDEDYAGIRTQILMQNPLPSVEMACGIFLQEELERNVLGTTRFSVESSAMYGKTQSQGESSVGKQGKQETQGEKNCSACGKRGHEREKCWSVVA